MLDKLVASVRRVRPEPRQRRARRTRGWAMMTTVVCVFVGLMMTVSSLNARGTDLRPGRNTDQISLIQQQSRRNTELAREVSTLRREVDGLSSNQETRPGGNEQLLSNQDAAGLTPVRGPAVSVTLTDAPSSVKAPGVDQDLLVVHQQDIQAVVNVLWESGAEAMTIQGQRVVSTTGIKCVGNTVVLHGTPYAPPYVISAMGDPKRLEAGLANSKFIRVYKQYVDAYHLGYAQRTDNDVTFPEYRGPLELEHASVQKG